MTEPEFVRPAFSGRSWPVATVFEGEIRVCGEKVLNGVPCLMCTDGRLFIWTHSEQGYLDSLRRWDDEVDPGDIEPQEPDMTITDLTDPLRDIATEVQDG